MHIESIYINLGERDSSMARAFMQSLFQSSPETSTQEPQERLPVIGEQLHGGTYASLSRGEEKQPDGHIVLLPNRPEHDMTWDEAVKWAESVGDGARLPTRFESALLYANVFDKLVAERWHWTGTQSSSGHAWSQDFGYGSQGTLSKDTKARAVAVRRLIL